MIKEKAEYIRGLADGMNIAAENGNNEKLFRAIIDCLCAMAEVVDDNAEAIDAIDEDLNDIYEAMDVYDEILFEDEDDEEEDEDFECDCDDCERECDDCDCGCGCEEADPHVVCANCGEEIPLDELLNCPRCHKPVFDDDDVVEIKD
ncbi:MAG: hypothetical protein IJM85_01960 [Clostridia bacterium]|nr:hypothetical protein [Clostridia bacterium]